MHYESVLPAVFLKRPNRFVAHVRLPDGSETRAHVKNTGRCAELLLPGAVVYLAESQNAARKTAYDLIAVEKPVSGGVRLINLDSAAPNAAAREWLQSCGLGALERLRPEYTQGESRFDFYALQGHRPVLVEVKGCTLEENGIALFPDAPTLRGLKHVRALTRFTAQGFRCCVLLVCQMKGVRVFRPNWKTHPDFAFALRDAVAAGVEVRAVDCLVTPNSLQIDGEIPVDLCPPFPAEASENTEL